LGAQYGFPDTQADLDKIAMFELMKTTVNPIDDSSG
jgi:hypothetical protein